jgi:hypothetical protein
MQQMQANAEWHKRQRDMEMAKYISDNTTPETAPSVSSFVKSQNGDPSMVPQLRYNTESVTLPGESVGTPEMGNIRGSMPEEYAPDTQTSIKTPIEWSDWGAGAAFKQKGLDLKQRLAEMSMETKSYLAQLKAGDAKSAVGKIAQDLASGRISQALANDAFLKATIYFDPANSALIAQGLDPRQSGMTRQFSQTKGAYQLPQGAPGQPQMSQATGGNMGQQQEQPMTLPVQPQQPAPRAQGAPVRPSAPGKAKGPGATPFLGGKQAIIDAEEQKALEDYIGAVDTQIAHLKTLRDHPGIDKGTGMNGQGWRIVPGTPEYSFDTKLKSGVASKVIATINKMKMASKTGATGFGALSEPENQRLIDADVSLNPKLNKKDFQASVDEYIKMLEDQKKRADRSQKAVSAARNLGPGANKVVDFADIMNQ